MKPSLRVLMPAFPLLLLLAIVLTAAPPKPFAPPPAVQPSEESLNAIKDRKEKLESQLAQLRRLNVRGPAMDDIEVYLKAAKWTLDHNEFFDKDSAAWTIAALGRGLLRAGQRLEGEFPWYYIPGVTVVHGYRSQVDDSVQPYAATFPADYGKDKTKQWRLEVVLHGRNSRLSEIAFIHAHDDKPAPKNQDYVRLDIYGRGNNGYRWAGETDVREAVTNFLLVERNLGRVNLLDLKRGVLRGFSMGGAGVWHLGLHRPEDWCALSPGAGFVRTHGYVKDLPKLTDYQEACLHIYDAIDYAENAFNVPVVAYAGEKDPQREAALLMEKRMRELQISMKLLTAPNLGHDFPPEWRKKAAEARSKFTTEGRAEYPQRVRFVTYTLKYAHCNWVEIIGMERHYERASVDAARTEDEGLKIQTSNVRSLHLKLWPGVGKQPVKVQIDGRQLEAVPYLASSQAESLQLYLERRDGGWCNVMPEYLQTKQLRHRRKMSGVQGPIDDAFTTRFLCVRGTGKPWHEATALYAEADLKRFREEWKKYMRGELTVKDDTDVEPSDITGCNLILFGDPSSNSLIAQILPELPLKWNKEKIVWQNQDYAAGEHVPVLIYPSPFSPLHYVVLNSGHTFHAADFQGTNALLYPRLGDFAILKLTGAKKDPLAVEVQTAGLFDDDWRVPQK